MVRVGALAQAVRLAVSGSGAAGGAKGGVGVLSSTLCKGGSGGGGWHRASQGLLGQQSRSFAASGGGAADDEEGAGGVPGGWSRRRGFASSGALAGLSPVSYGQPMDTSGDVANIVHQMGGQMPAGKDQLDILGEFGHGGAGARRCRSD